MRTKPLAAAMIGQFSEMHHHLATATWVAWACTLAPDASGIGRRPRPGREGRPERSQVRVVLEHLGRGALPRGRFDEALARLSEVEALVQEPSEASNSSPAYTWFFLAMTQHRLGHAEEAKQWLDKAVAWTDKIFAEADQGTADLSWNRRLTLKLLRDEATALLGVTPPAVEPAPEPAAKEGGATEMR